MDAFLRELAALRDSHLKVRVKAGQGQTNAHAHRHALISDNSLYTANSFQQERHPEHVAINAHSSKTTIQ